METAQVIEPPQRTNIESRNISACQKIIRDWADKPDSPSSMAIRILHKELHDGIESYGKKGLTPISPGEYRKSDIHVSGEPDNFYVRGTDVSPIMDSYTRKLDSILQNLPTAPLKNVESIMHEAAWAYYVFERIHPFLDGNGRIGRMIAKRIITGGGVRDLIFHDARWNGKKRSNHLDAMNRVDKTGNLSHLELYFLRSMKVLYEGEKDKPLLEEVEQVIKHKEKEVQNQNRKKQIGEIWEPFADLDLAGNG